MHNTVPLGVVLARAPPNYSFGYKYDLCLQCRASYQLGLYKCRLASPMLLGYIIDIFHPNWTLLVTVCSFYLWTPSNSVKGFL